MKLKVEVKPVDHNFNGIKEKDFGLEQAKITDLNYDGNYPAPVVDRIFYGVYAKEDFSEGHLIHELEGTWRHKPTRHSIQIGEKHLDSAIGGYLNHSCDPNASILIQLQDMSFKKQYVPSYVGVKGTLTSMIISNPKPVVVANKPIFAGQEITFNYNSTEDLMAEPFDCNCGSENCLGKIAGRLYF